MEGDGGEEGMYRESDTFIEPSDLPSCSGD